MKKPITITLFAVLIISLLVASFAVSPVQAAYDSGRRGPTGNRGQRVLSQSTTAVVLTDQEKIDLGEAIREEYTAMNTYLGISKEYGDNALFARIARSEQQHVNALIRVAERHGVEVPENSGEVAEVEWTTYAEACEFGVKFEKLDAGLYDELLAKTSNPELVRVYTRLQSASLNNHLRAFETCLP